MTYTYTGSLPIDEVVARYQAGEPTTVLAKEYGCRPSTILRVLERLGVPRRPVGYRKYQLTVPEVKTISELDAYWLGFILADGCVCDKGGLHVQLAAREKKHLSKLRTWLLSEHPITEPVNAARISIYSKQLVVYLQEFGITQRKSFTAKVDKRLAMNRHFWRGMLDGDGYIAIKDGKYPTLALVGTKAVCQKFSDFARTITGVVYTIHERRGQNHFVVTTTGRDATAIITAIYSNGVIALDRKLKVANIIMSQKQKPGPRERTKSIKKTGTAGPRAKRRKKHGKGKKQISRSSKKKR